MGHLAAVWKVVLQYQFQFHIPTPAHVFVMEWNRPGSSQGKM